MEKIISVYWFVILIIVAGGIVAMVSIFYSHPYDVREAEATILLNKVADCVVSGGVINYNIIDNHHVFLDSCNLNLDTEQDFEKGQYYFEVEVQTLEGINDYSIYRGNPALKTHCDPQAQEEIKKLSKCVESVFYALEENGDQKLVRILSVVRKTTKNVRG